VHLRSTAVFLFQVIELALLFTVTASAQTSLWAGPKPRGPLKPFVLDMMGTLRKDDGAVGPPITFHDTLEKTRWHGHRAMRRVAATTMPGGTEFARWSVVVFDERTLLPYYTELRRADGAFMRREFDGVHVKETRTAGDYRKPLHLAPGTKPETVMLRFDLSEPAFAWAEGVGLPVLLAAPLRDGFAGSVPVISGDRSAVMPCFTGPCFVHRLTYRVMGREEITGISGKPTRTWKISVPETGFTFWISCENPRLEGVTWPAFQGGGTFSMGPLVRN